MSRLKVQWEPSTSKGTEYFSWEELDCEDDAEWLALDDQLQAERIAQALDGISGLVYAQSVDVSISSK